MSIRIGIYGYGNLGRGVENAIKQNPDMTLVGVFTRRDPSTVKINTENASVYSADKVFDMKDAIDVMIICGGSATDLPEQTPMLAEHFNVPYVVAQGAPARLGMPNDMEEYEKYTVRYSDCDHNQHLRACEYVNFICDAAEYWTGPVREKKGRALNVEFLGECKAGETLTICRKFTPEAVYVSGSRPDGKVSFKAYFVME